MGLYVDIRKSIGDFRLDVKFEAENEAVALLGASGCGKSMTLKCIAGIEKPDEGRIILNGRTLFDSEKRIDLKPQQRRVGYLFQQYALFPNMTVYQNIYTAVRKRPNAHEIVERKIDHMRLRGLENLRPHQLSGGQQQRVALARILANKPELMLLDEPFSALDSYLRWDLEMELRDTLQSFGGASVFVSHSREEVYRVCDSVCVLSKGRSEEKVSVRELFSSPCTVEACKLTGCKNLSRIERISNRRIRALDWGMELETASDVKPEHTWMGIQARDMRVSDSGTECTIERVVEDEHGYILLLRTPGPGQKRSRLRMMMRKDQYHGEAVGNKLLISFPPEYIMLLKE